MTKKISYKKPIITEILAEVHLTRGSLPPEKFFSLVPLIQKNGQSLVEFNNSNHITIAENGQAQQQIAPRVKCWSPDKKKLIQLGPDLIIVNLVGEYPGWTTFKSLFDEVLVALNSITTATYSHLSLITIDRFEVPKTGFTIDKYVNCNGSRVPQWYKGSNCAADIILGHGSLQTDKVNMQFNLRISHKQTTMEILTQSTFQKLLSAGEQVGDLLNSLHEESNESFESWITDKTRNEIMGGSK